MSLPRLFPSTQSTGLGEGLCKPLFLEGGVQMIICQATTKLSFTFQFKISEMIEKLPDAQHGTPTIRCVLWECPCCAQRVQESLPLKYYFYIYFHYF
jgi:hypothetical protein